MKHVGVLDVSTFPLLGIWSLSGFHKFGIGCEESNFVQIGPSLRPLERLLRLKNCNLITLEKIRTNKRVMVNKG